MTTLNSKTYQLSFSREDLWELRNALGDYRTKCYEVWMDVEDGNIETVTSDEAFDSFEKAKALHRQIIEVLDDGEGGSTGGYILQHQPKFDLFA